MKRILLLLTVLSLVAFAFCGCDIVDSILGDANQEEEHVHTYAEASCEAPKTCTECNETDGAPLGHSYNDADCDTPATCTVCGKTEGAPLGHDYTAATCTQPETCKICGAVSNRALGHSYSDATCESAAVCEKCGETYGEPVGHNYEQTVTKPTCTEGGYTTFVCSACGDTYTAEQTAPLGHSYGSDYLYNDNYHWLECSVCQYKKDEGQHMGGETNGNERAKCEVCSAYYGKEPGVSIDWEIGALTPEVGSTFSLANYRVKNWYETFDFRTTDTDQYWLEEDIFMPEAPFFTWSVGEAALYYKLYVSEYSDFSSYNCYLTSNTSLTVEHLYTGHTYYWIVDAVYSSYTVRSEVFSFMTQATPRTVNIEGVSNSRDIGGYLTEDGMRIKQGLVYRSAKLDQITELGRYTLLNVLGVKTDLDLRGDRNDYYKNATHPVEELNHIVVACPWYSTGSNHIWLDEYNKTEFAKAVKVFADPDNYPIIFHCSLGRDRTGTLAMVLEGLLGVDENTLMMEYELSVFSYWGTNGGTKYNTGLRNNIHDTYLYIYNNYEGDTFSEKVEDFLLEIGVTAEEIASIKDIMLEEVQ